ncbi:MAG: hypothetical protein WBK71_09205 [Acetomicrobium sp.]
MDFKRKDCRMFLLFFLVLNLLLLSAVCALAQGKGYGVEVRPMVPPLVEANPGEIVSLSFVVENMTGKEETFEESLALPEGWLVITPPDVFTLREGEETVRVLAFQVSATADAREYPITYSVRSKRDYAIRDEATVRLSVFAVSDIKFFLESAPDTVMSGESYEIRARLANGGNATIAVVVSARSTSKYPITFLSEKELTLSPGESAPVALLVQTPSKLAKSARHIVILEASSKEDPSVRTSLSVATEVLSQKAEIDLYHRIPTTLTLRAMGERNGDDSDGFDVEFKGNGTLEEGGRKRVEFLFRGPDTQDKGLYGERDEYYMNYFDPNLDLRLGDQSYGLSRLTSYSRYGRGVEAKYHPEERSFGFGSYYLENRFTLPDWEEKGVYVGGALSPSAKLKLNYLRKERDSYKNTPRIKDDVYSIEGEFNPVGDMRLGLEYAEGERKKGGRKYEDEAYRAELSGSLGETRYYFSKTHAEPDFYGYYNDSDYMSSSFNFPLSSRMRGYVSYSGYETNLDKRLDKGDTSTKETLFQTGINYSLSQGWYARFAYDNFSRKDRIYPSKYDIKEEAYRLSVGRSAGNFNYRVEARYADQYDRIRGISASPWNYSFYASYMPSDELFLTFYGGFGDNAAIRGSRLLSDQDNLGFSFRWLATEQLTLIGWYTKYNFDSKRPESDQYSFELKYMMPDESYWTFKIRRYDWEYSEYVETDYLISYSIPIGIPVGKKKSLGMLIGRVWRSQEEGKAPLTNAVVTLNGSKVATDASGRFTFAAPPGEYLLDVSRASIGLGNTAAEKLPMKVSVEAGETANVELTIVEAAVLRGQVVLGVDESAYGPNHNELVVVGEPNNNGTNGSAEVSKVFRGILVELSRDDEVIRTMSDDEGKFTFMELRPGTWKFKVYDYNIPAYHYIQNPEMDITLLPGEKKDITVKVVPKKREIKILEEGVISSK